MTANLSEQDVLRIIADPKGISTADLGKIPIELGLMTETGYPHKGVIDYIAPLVDPSTGTLELRGMFANSDYALLPGLFVHVRVPPSQDPEQEALLVPQTALGSDQAGPLCAGRRQGRCGRKAQRDGRSRRWRHAGHRERAGADDKVIVAGLLRAVPGQKVRAEIVASAASSKRADAAR